MKQILCFLLANLLAAQSVLALPTPTPDHVGESFTNLKKFARDAEVVQVEAQVQRVPNPSPEPKDVKSSVLFGLKAEVAEMTDLRLGTAIPVTIEARSFKLQKFIKRSVANLREELGSLINGLASMQNFKDVVVTIEPSPFPWIESYGNTGTLRIRISMGIFAFAQNKDELAAAIAGALTQHDPQTYLIRDDPRILRRLNDQINFDGLTNETRQRLRRDVSVMERLRAANLRPWGLTDFDLRTFTYFREVYAKASALRIDRQINLGEEGESFYKDPLFETRILTQKIVASYMQDRENLRELIAKVSPLDPFTERLHRDAERYARSQFRAFRSTRAVARWTAAWFTLPMLLVADATGVLPATLHAFSDLANGTANFIGLGENSLYRNIDLAIQNFAANLQSDFDGMENTLLRAWRIGTEDFKSVVIPIGLDLRDGIFAVGHAFGVLIGLLGRLIQMIWYAALGPVLNFAWDSVVMLAAGAWHLISALGAFIGADVTQPIYDYILHPIYAHSDRRIILGAVGAATAVALYKYTPPSAKTYWSDFYKRVQDRSGRTARHFLYRNYGDRFFVEMNLPEDRIEPKKLIGIARDLGRIYPVIYINYQYDWPWDSLEYLSKFNVGPKQFLRFTTNFLGAVQRQVENQNLTNLELTTILSELSSSHPDLSLQRSEKRFPSYKMVENDLVDQMFHEPEAYAPMRRLYDAIKRRFPSPNPSPEFKKSLGDWNDTAIDAPHFLGLAKILREVEALTQNFEIQKALQLNQTLRDLRVFHIVNEMNERNFAAATEAIFNTGTPRELSGKYLSEILKGRSLHDQPDVRGRLGWPMFDVQLKALSAWYLRRKNIGAAAAAASWAAQANNTVGAGRDELKASLLRSALPNLAIKSAVAIAVGERLKRCQNVQELANFFEDLLRRGTISEVVAERAYKAVRARPELLRTTQDIDALIAHEFFWPHDTPWPGIQKTVANSFNYAFRNFASIEAPLVQQLSNNRSINPGVWRYDPIASSYLQTQIVARMEALHALPDSYGELKAFWRRLTNRGVTPTSDRLLHRLIAMVPKNEIADLQRNIVNEHRVWESDLHSRVVIASVTGSDDYQELLQTPPDDGTTHKREWLLESVVRRLGSLMQERGLTYIQFLEDLSNQIVSTYPEAKTIARAKGAVLDKESKPTKDENLEGLREVFKFIRNWPRADQFNLLLVLRDNVVPSARVVAAFPTIGLERVRRMYEILPVAARVGVLDTFFTLSLVREDKHSAKWVRRLTEHIVGGQKTESQKISLQILTGFLHAINEVGNGNLATTVLSYLYSLPSSATASPGEILKRVLEVFGATGIKLGQFLYASQILPEAEAQHLQSLQDRARVPTRIELFEDIYDILGLPSGSPLPFALYELLGAASMKYAVLGRDSGNLQQIVLKIFRLDAKNNVDLQFDVLERTAKFLVANYGERYGVLEVVIDSARQAVKREGSLQNEIRRSQIARKFVYQDRVRSSVRFACPREELINSRLIISEFAEGISFQDLPAELKPGVARAMLELEADNMFGEHDVIRFDPDRHAGNFRIHIRPAGPIDLEVNQIDFGQLLRMRRGQRDLIIQLFAIAQIVGKAGANEWAIERLGTILNLTEVQLDHLRAYLRRYLKSSQRNPVTTYVATLAALRRSGFEFENSTYLDFIRGIIQLTPYEKFAPEVLSSTKIFEQRVFAAIQDELKTFRFDPTQLKQIHLYNRWQKVKSYFNDKPAILLPTRADEIELNQFIRRELECRSNLDAA